MVKPKAIRTIQFRSVLDEFVEQRHEGIEIDPRAVNRIEQNVFCYLSIFCSRREVTEVVAESFHVCERNLKTFYCIRMCEVNEDWASEWGG